MLECSFNRLFGLLPKIPLSLSRALSGTKYLLTHYDTLKVKPNATAKDVKDAYLKLSKEYHPDRNPNDPHSHDRFVKLQEAYQILGNAEAKRNYDANLGLHGSSHKSSYKRPYGRPDFTQRDEWLRADKARREQQFQDTFRRPDDYKDFYQRYSQPHRLTPEEMQQFYRMKSFSKSGKEVYVTLGLLIVFVIFIEVYAARKKSGYFDYNTPFDDPVVTGRYPRSFDIEYNTQKLINEEKYREYLNREIEKGNVGPIEPRNKASSEV